MRALILLLAAAAAPAGASDPARLSADGCIGPPPTFGCANGQNFRAMAADPADLARGRDATPSPGALDAAAIERLRADKVKDYVGAGASDAFKSGGAPK